MNLKDLKYEINYLLEIDRNESDFTLHDFHDQFFDIYYSFCDFLEDHEEHEEYKNEIIDIVSNLDKEYFDIEVKRELLEDWLEIINKNFKIDLKNHKYNRCYR